MKIANALSRRKYLISHIDKLKVRLLNNAKVQQGDQPLENPSELLDQIDNDIKELEDIEAKIELTNSSTTVEGISLTEMVSKRDALKRKVDVLTDFINACSLKIDRNSVKDIKIVPSVNVKEMVSLLDDALAEYTDLAERLEEYNWTFELF